MEKKTKELIKNILDNECLIPSRIWRDILWLQDGESLGISRDRRFVWIDKLGKHEGNWQNFFRKSKKRWKDSSILAKLQDYLLFLKGDKLTAREVLSCRNVEIRSLLLNQFGHEKLIKELEGKIIHQEGDSQLINLNLGNITEHIRVVKVKDSTTKKYYILRVPPTVKTCRQAIAWTFGLEEDEYNPTIET
ncbi:MAG: DUF6745 domain-containing protein [Candidatus Hodarchaeota archaeon]